MGRLPALNRAVVLCWAVLLPACNDRSKLPPAPVKSRSAAVEATASTTTPVASTAIRRVAPPKPRGPICAGQLGRPGKSLPAGKFARQSAPGAPALPAQFDPGGKWTWVNFWAAWCEPCKEEIPRLRAWEKALNRAGQSWRLVFVSLDDDPRQLEQFLAGQPEAGLRSTYWLRDPNEREKWLKEAGIPDPELPVQLLLDPTGKVRCTVLGAVEDADFEQVRTVARGR